MKEKKSIDDNPNSFTIKKRSAKATPDLKYISTCYLKMCSLHKFENLEMLPAMHHYHIIGILET